MSVIDGELFTPREIPEKEKTHFVLARTEQEYLDWLELETPKLKSLRLYTPARLLGMRPNEVVVVQANPNYAPSFVDEIKTMGFAIKVAEQIKSCRNCQYFLYLGDSKICNALHSVPDSFEACEADWTAKDEAEEAKRQEELQARVTKEEKKPQRSFFYNSLAETFDAAAAQIERERERESERHRRILEYEALREARRPGDRFYENRVTVTELEQAKHCLNPADYFSRGSTKEVVIRAERQQRIESKKIIFVVEQYFVKEYGMREPQSWKAWVYSGNLGQAIME